MAKVRCINCEKKINLKKDDHISDESLGTYWCVACGYEDACKELQEECVHLREMLKNSRRAFRRRKSEVKTLQNACKKRNEENTQLREALEKIYEETKFAEVVTIRLKDVHELARQALGVEGNP